MSEEPGLIIVHTRMQEFNYPGPDGPVYTRYQGQGGVLLSSLFRRLLYAWQFRDLNILISGKSSQTVEFNIGEPFPSGSPRSRPFSWATKTLTLWLPMGVCSGSKMPIR